jgi:hypothetical protein
MNSGTGSVAGREGVNFWLALAFPFQDGSWFKKILLPALIQFIPIVGILAATGWALEIVRRAVRGDAQALPALRIRRDLAGGLAVWGVILLYGTPLWLWLAAGVFSSVLLWRAKIYMAGGYFDALWRGIECGALPIALAAAMGVLAAVGRFAETGSFRSALRVREALAAIRAAPTVHLLAVLAWIPLGLLAALGVALCGVGAFFTAAYALAAGSRLAGQAQLAAAERVASGSVPGRT